MRLLNTIIFCLGISFYSYAQQGINYKAIIKDNLGNVVANQSVTVQFTIQQGVAMTTVYEESHNSTTDVNGIIILNIGEGTPISGTYNAIPWGSDEHHLNVQVDLGDGLVDLGTTQFKAVPYALEASNVSGLEAIDEGNGTGWRLKERDADNYDNIGSNAVDLSNINNPALGLGATGSYALSVGLNNTASGAHAFAFGTQSYALNDYTISMGNNNNVSGLNSSAIGAINQVTGDYSFAAGLSNIISGNNSVALGQQAEAVGVNSQAIGLGSEATGDYSTAIGQESTASGLNTIAIGPAASASGIGSVAVGTINVASGDYSSAQGSFSDALGDYSTAFGRNINATSYGSFIVGFYNSNDFGNSTQPVETDVLFQIGNGTSDASRSNALTVRKNGSQILTSSSFGMEITAGNGSSDHGIEINNAGGNGILISSAADDGIRIFNVTNVGLAVNADDAGARISGDNVGVYASGGESQDDIPDIILGSSSFQFFNDDGIISTDPDRASSDMFLRSYDAVVVNLDYDNNEGGNFRIRNGSGTNVFDVNESGNVRVNGTVVHSSDRRLKTSITDLAYGLEEILNLHPKSYFWKDHDEDKRSIGLIAQEVKPIINEVVNEQDDDVKTLGISYTELIPVLINAIKEQQNIISDQSRSMNEMKNQLKNQAEAINRLEARFNQMDNIYKTDEK